MSTPTITLAVEDGYELLDLISKTSALAGEQIARYELHKRLWEACNDAMTPKVGVAYDGTQVGLAAAEICHDGSVPANYVTMLETENRMLREAAQNNVLVNVASINHVRDSIDNGSIIHTITALGALVGKGI